MRGKPHGTVLPSSGSLSGRLVMPVVGLLLAAVLANVAFAAWWSAARSSRAAADRRAQVASMLAESRVAVTLPVLSAMQRLTGDHFVVWNGPDSAVGASTLPEGSIDVTALGRATRSGDVAVAGRRYRVGVVRSAGARPETLLVLSPLAPLAATTLEVVWPVLAVAAATLAVLVPISLATTRRIATRIAAIDRHVGRIGDGEFGDRLPELPAGGEPEEIARLAGGVNRLSGMLAGLRESLLAGERQRLLGQLAAGFAHELRNAVTGAQLAIDVHRRRCTAAGGQSDESLAVAVRQLSIVEEEVKGLLALGKPAEAVRGAVSVDRLIAEVRDLTSPRCEHAGVRLECGIPSGLTIVGRGEPLRAAVVNLALNGIEAAGPGGSVRLTGTSKDDTIELAVEDTGPGPPEAIRASLGEPFVTGKPEGIGLGLAIAKAVAEEHGGTLRWSRLDDRTRFVMALPATPRPDAASPNGQRHQSPSEGTAR